jgi:hypothetical protein
MIRILEIAWLCIAAISVAVAIYQFVTDGWQSAMWMLFVSGVSVTMFRIRRGQRVKMGKNGG